jgi:signal transduction histidine kinase
MLGAGMSLGTNITIFRRAARFHVALTVGIVLSAATLLLCIAVGTAFKDELEKQFHRETRNIAEVLITDFNSTIRNLDALLFELGSEYLSIDANSSNKLQQLHELLKQHAPDNSPSIALMIIIDKNGKTIAISSDDSFSPTDKFYLTNFAFHASNPVSSSLYVGAPVYGPLAKQWIIQFSHPLKNTDGIFDGVVVICYKLLEFEKLFEKLDVKNLGIVSLVGLDRIIRIRSRGEKLSYGETVPTGAPVFKKIMDGAKEGAFNEPSVFDNVSRIGYFIVSDIAPLYVYVAYDRSYIASQYEKIVFLLGISWSLFSLALMGAIFYIQKIERLRQQARVHANEAVSVERKRILVDMHDSIGASLAVLISHFNPAAPNWVELKRRATQILTELRLLVDSLGTERANLTDVLGSVRHRMHGGIELAGITIVWKVNHAPTISSLTAHDALALRLILMEALSNVLCHSNAKTITFSVENDEAAGLITISIADDGCGFDVATTARGVGLDSMQNRAKSMSLPTTVRINSGPGKGTTVRIEMRMPAEVKVSA